MQNKILIPCNFDYMKYNSKPNNDTTRNIKINLGKGFAELDVFEIVRRLTSGQAMGFYGLKGTKGSDFICARQFGLDFDNENMTEEGKKKIAHNRKVENKDNQKPIFANDFLDTITYEQVINRLKKTGLEVAYTIKTMSDQKYCDIRKKHLDKFKVFLVSDELITDPKEVTKIITALQDFFPEADQSGKDLARFTFGTVNGSIGETRAIANKKQLFLDLCNTTKGIKKQDKVDSEPKRQHSKNEVDLAKMYNDFPLLQFILNKRGGIPTKQGNMTYITPHPYTGSPKSKGFCVYDDNTFCDYSNGNFVGSIFHILSSYEYENMGEQEAREYIKEYNGIDVKAEKKEWAKNKSLEKKPTNPTVEIKKEDVTEFPFPDEVYLNILNQETEVQRVKLYQEWQAKAKELGKIREYSSTYKAFEKDKPKKKEVESNVTAYDIDNELYCGHWIADKQGIRTFNASGEVKASNTPVYPLKLLRNQQSQEQKCKIAYFDKYKWNELFVEKEMLMTSTKIVGLSKYGLLVTSEMAKHLTNYFAEVFQKNHFEELPSTSKMGWYENNKSFLPITFSNIELDAHISFSSLIDSMKETGDKELYLDFIRKQLTNGRKEVKFAILASLASVLLAPMNALPFIVHIYGQAGIGKTLLLKICAGIWGKPIENGFIQDPKGTLTSFEVLLGLLNNLPFIADDINKLSQSSQFSTLSELTYFLCSGNGKPRSNLSFGIREPQTWHNVSILNGEKALTAEDSHGGELLRTIELQLEPFALFEDGSGTADFLHNNYGFLGKMFVEWLIKYEQIQQAKNMKKHFSSEIKRIFGNKKEGKQVESVGVLYATYDILCGMLGIERTLEVLDFASLIKNIDDVLDTQRAYEKICNIIMQNSSCFLHKDKMLEKFDKEPNVRWGWYSKDDYYIIPTQFAKLCKDVNVDKKLFIEWAIEKKHIESAKNRNDGSKVFLIQEQDKRIRLIKMTIAREDEDL